MGKAALKQKNVDPKTPMCMWNWGVPPSSTSADKAREAVYNKHMIEFFAQEGAGGVFDGPVVHHEAFSGKFQKQISVYYPNVAHYIQLLESQFYRDLHPYKA